MCVNAQGGQKSTQGLLKPGLGSYEALGLGVELASGLLEEQLLLTPEPAVQCKL